MYIRNLLTLVPIILHKNKFIIFFSVNTKNLVQNCSSRIFPIICTCKKKNMMLSWGMADIPHLWQEWQDDLKHIFLHCHQSTTVLLPQTPLSICLCFSWVCLSRCLSIPLIIYCSWILPAENKSPDAWFFFFLNWLK